MHFLSTISILMRHIYFTCLVLIMSASLSVAQTSGAGVLVRTIQETGTDADGTPISTDDAEQENDAMDALDDDDIDTGWEGAPEDQNILTCGLRFRGIFIPQGAVIDSAFIQVWSHEDKSTDDVAELVIAGEASDDPETYTLDALITDRPRTTSQIDWTVDEEWGLWSQERTPYITDIVQELVNRPGWQSGNSMAFMFLGQDQGASDVENAREFESFENISDPEDGGDGQNYPSRIPRLVIYASAITSVNVPVVGELKVYPNPAKEGAFTVALKNALPAELRLFNQAGQEVRRVSNAGQASVTISTDDLSNGIYSLQVVQDQTRYTERVTIQR